MSVEKEKPKKNTTGQRSGPDTAEKLLEDYEDVFADIVNVLVYEGDPVVQPENLRDGPTASVSIRNMVSRSGYTDWRTRPGQAMSCRCG